MKNLKNIVIVADYAHCEGGASNVAIQEVLLFEKHTNYNIYFFAGSGEPSKQLLTSKAKVIVLGLPDLLGNTNRLDACSKGIYNKKTGNELKKLLTSLNPKETVVHIHTWTKVLSSSVFKVCDKLGFKTFLTIHDYFLICPNGACFNHVNHKICEFKPLSLSCLMCNCDSRSYFHKVWRILRQIKQNCVIRHFTNLHFIFISSFQENQLMRRMSGIVNSSLIKNPIIVGDRFRIHAEENSEFIFIGRVCGEKGPQLFCQAIYEAGVSGTVIGSGALLGELKEQYRNIDFCGWLNQEQIKERIKQARALIFPSLWYEGSPLTTLEVLAYGIPCIVTNCSSATEDIVHHKNGEVVMPTVFDIVSAINKFKDDEYVKRLSENAYQLFDERRASEEYYVKCLTNLYLGDECAD